MRRLILSIAIVAAGSIAAHAQSAKPHQEQVFKYVEQVPEFRGSLNNYLMENLNYPEAARKAGTQGKVYVQFIVSEQGYIKAVEVIKSSGNAALDAEAVRVIAGMNSPDGTAMWKPGKNNGQPVNTYFTLPVVFSMQ